MSSYFAFFDVDETLFNLKSMLSFASFHCPDRYQLFMRCKPRKRREDQNRLYYRTILQGLRIDDVERAGAAWYRAQKSVLGDQLFIMPTMAELRRHAANGAMIGLVSGSFPALIMPMIEDLGITCTLLCTKPTSFDGKYTGAIAGEPVIGQGKARVVAALAKGNPQLSLEKSYAYGDDPSDQPLLESVGNGYWVRGHSIQQHVRG